MGAERVCDVCGWQYDPESGRQARCPGVCRKIGRATSDRLANIKASALLYEMLAMLRQQYFQCSYCCSPLVSRTKGLAAHIDHKEPICSGGTDELSNLQWVCISCNRDKGRLPDAEYRAVMEHRQGQGLA